MDMMVGPDGKSYPSGGNHLEWCHENYSKFGIPFVPYQTVEYEPTTDAGEAVMDKDGRIALDLFLDEGWIRLKSSNGIELRYLGPDNIDLVKRLLANMAKSAKGRTLFVDAGDGSMHVPVAFTGRPDFSVLDAHVGQATTASWVRAVSKFAWHEPRPDYSLIAHEAVVEPVGDKFVVKEKSTGEVLSTFVDQGIAKSFARDYEEASNNRKAGGKIWEMYSPFSEEGKNKRLEKPQLITGFDLEQLERDIILAPYTFQERIDRFKNLRRKGLPYVPIIEKEIREFREKPARPHGVELPAPKGVPDVPSVRDLFMERPKMVAWVNKNCKFASLQGEWWIDDAGNVTYADGDFGDYNHAMIAFENALSISLEDANLPNGIAPMEKLGREAVTWLTQNGSDPAAIKALSGGADPRDYMMKRFNWIRVASDVATCWRFDQDSLDRLAGFVMELAEDHSIEATGSIMVEELSTHQTWDIPYAMLARPGIQVDAVKHISSGVGRFR